jgi:acyl-CoA synthetase (NDP forming)
MPFPVDPQAFFAPKSVAFIGASEDNDRFRSLYDNLTAGGRTPEIQFVNPNRETVFDAACYDSIADVPVTVDLAVIVVPASVVPSVFEECGQAGVGAAIVVSAGFAETGEQGRQRERRLRELSEQYDLPFCGPNTFGMLSTYDRTFLAQISTTDIPSGNVGAVLQSGGLLNQLLASGRQRGFGFSKVIDSGNGTSISATQFIEHLIEDDHTDVVVGVIEGFSTPKQFLDVAAKAVREGVPLIVLKLAQSETGQDIAQSHTGAVATSRRITSAVFDQYGVVRVNSFDMLIEAAELFAKVDSVDGNGVGVIEISGGGCTLFSDAIAETELELPTLSPAATEQLQDVVPPIGVVRNPVDLAMGWQTEAMETAHPTALRTLANEPEIDIVVSRLSVPESGALGPIADRLTEIQDVAAESETVFAVVSRASGCVSEEWTSAVSETEVPFLQEYHKATETLEKLHAYVDVREHFEDESETTVDETLRLDTTGTMTEYEATQTLAEIGLPVVEQRLTTSKQQALNAAEAIGYPVCLKLASSTLQHKSDVGGVKTDIADPDDLRRAYDELEAIAETNPAVGADTMRGVLVQEMLDEGQEILVGAKQTPFGQAVVVGLGGIFTEVLGDTSIRIAPVSSSTSRRMLQELDGYEALTGVRGQDAVDIEGLCDVIARFSEFVAVNDHLVEADLNPVIATADRISIVDALFRFDQD